MPKQLKLFDARFIRLGDRFVPYQFARRRRRTLGISVNADGLSVAAPLRAPVCDIESFLLDKQRWILSKLDEWSSVPRPAVLRVESGALLPLFGAPVMLEVCAGGRAIEHHAERLMIRVPRLQYAWRALLGWLKLEALEALTPRAAHFAALLGVAPPRVVLSNARTQWGVCTESGTIRLNWRLVHLAPELGDYVVAHEVAHLAEMNHSKRFWAQVEKLYPAWREARERLELAGASIPTIKEAR